MPENAVPLDVPYYGAPITAAFTRFWRKYGVFSGRASRSEFWWWILVAFVVDIVLQIISSATGHTTASATRTSHSFFIGFNDSGPAGIILGLWSLATIIPLLALGARRLHDANISGWFMLFVILPFVGEIVILILALQSSKPAGQRFDRGTVPSQQQGYRPPAG
jgi:uncharacterized membrane protein YhaH (DUF805 family)